MYVKQLIDVLKKKLDLRGVRQPPGIALREDLLTQVKKPLEPLPVKQLIDVLG